MLTQAWPAVMSLALTVAACGQACEGQWLGGGPAAGLNGDTYVLAEWDPDGPGPEPNFLVAGGSFNRAGGVVVNGVALWDGRAWRALGSGLTHGRTNPPTSYVFALTIFNGDLIAAGSFDIAGGTPCSNIARWDGSAWHPLGAGAAGTIYALATVGADLAVGGDFEQIGGVSSWKTATWDGSAWHTMGRRVPGSVYSLAVYDGALYSGGDYCPYSSTHDTEGPIARWNGSTWTSVGTGIIDPDAQPIVRALYVFNGELIVGGTFTNAGGIAAHGIAAWNGVNWRSIGSPIAFGRSFATVDGQLLAGGGLGSDAAHFIARWSGSSWSTLAEGLDGRVFALESHNNVLFAGGAFLHASGIPSPHLARWSTPSPDFNHDGSPATDQDIEAFFACLAGDCCPTCDSADFNSDGDSATDADIEAFFRVLAGGSC